MSKWVYEGTANIDLTGESLEVSHPNTGRHLATLTATSYPELLAAMNGEAFLQIKLNIYSDGTVEIAEGA